jgi:hypothetical protein
VLFGFDSFGLARGLFCNFVSARVLSSAAYRIVRTWACGVGRLVFLGQTELATSERYARLGRLVWAEPRE